MNSLQGQKKKPHNVNDLSYCPADSREPGEMSAILSFLVCRKKARWSLRASQQLQRYGGVSSPQPSGVVQLIRG